MTRGAWARVFLLVVGVLPLNVGAQCLQLSGVFSATEVGQTGGASNESGSCGGGGAADAVYFYSAPRSGDYTIDTIGSAFDTVLYVRDFGGGELACNDDITPGSETQSRLSVHLSAGQMISVIVDGFATASGQYTLRINGNCPQLGRNDPRDLGGALAVSVSGTTTCATFSVGGATCGMGGDNAPDATFLYTAPAAGTYTIDTTDSGFDTILYVRNGSCAAAELGCNDDIDPGVSSQSRLVLGLAAGQTILIAVDGYQATSGAFGLNVTGSPYTPSPSRTRTPTRSPTTSPTRSPSRTTTATVTVTRSPTRTASRTPTRTASRTATRTPTRSLTATATPSRTPTSTLTPTPSGSATSTRSLTATVTLHATSSPTPSVTASASRTATVSVTPSLTTSATPTASATVVPSATMTASPSALPSATATATATDTPPATPIAVVVDFEILPSDGPGLPAAVLANSQYADLGVLFNNPAGIDYARGSTLPGFAHSGTKAVEACYGAEFCTAPIAMAFAAPQRRLQVWVGYRGRLDALREVVLVALDAAGAEIARAVAFLEPAVSSQAIQLPLALELPSAAIVAAEVRFAPPTLLTSGLAVDDVEFDHAGSAACGSSRDPVVSISAPAAGSSTQTNQLLLSGRIDAQAPLDQVLLLADGPTQQRRIDLLASGALPPGAGVFGPLRITGLLEEGANTVTLIARDCHGSELAQIGVRYEPLAAAARVALEHIEVTQAVQDVNNGVPLIADKRTLVRAYLRAQPSGTRIRNLRGTLTACRPLSEAAPICGDFFPKLYAADAIGVDDAGDLQARRIDASASLNFELPREWSSAGRLHLQIADLEVDGLPAELACDGCDNLNVFGFPGFHSFETAKPLSFLLFEVEYEEGGVSHTPRFTDVYHLRSWLERAYPVSRVIAPNISFSAGFDSVPSAGVVNANLFIHKAATRTYNALLGWFAGKIKDSGVYYGLVYDGGTVGGQAAPFFMRGLSNDTLGVGSGPTGLPNDTGNGWDSDQSYGDWYGGHEIGHLHGRDHPGFVLGPPSGQGCVSGKQDDSSVDGSFPNANGSIADPGWDAGDAGLGIAAQILPPYSTANVNGWTDVMTYCNYEWISAYTYSGILARIDPDVRRDAKFAGAAGVVADALVISGTMNLSRDTVELLPFLRLDDAPLSERPSASAFSIDLLDDQGLLLVRYPFAPALDSELPSGADVTAVLAEVVPFDPLTRTIVIAKNGVALALRAVSEHAPSVQLLAPNGGETLQGSSTVVTWTGADADGDALRYTLLYSTDAGTTWFPVAVDLAASQHTLALETLPGSTQVRLRVIATDGVNTSIDDGDGVVVVPPKTPEVRIVAPAIGAPFSTRQTIVFVGDAFDREDGDLDDAALGWLSDRQGGLGSGRSIAVSGLQPGHHVISLEATDSDGLRGGAQLEIEVVADAARALISAPRAVVHGTVAELEAGASAGVGVLSYRWAIASKPAGSDASLTVNGMAARLQTDSIGRYEIMLIVTDAHGQIAIARAGISAIPPCAGDCNRDAMVSVEELLGAMRSALGVQVSSPCDGLDVDGNAAITIDELITVVNHRARGCPP